MPLNEKLYDLQRTAVRWSTKDLDHLLEALRRDRTLCPKELVRFVQRKTISQITELLHCIMSCPEEHLSGQASVVRAESTIDILSQTTKRINPYLSSSHQSVSDALNYYASELERQSPPQIALHVGEIRFPELYRFLSAATQNRPLPFLNPSESAAMLDLLACLVRAMQSAQNEIKAYSDPEGSNTPTASRQDCSSLGAAWKSVSTRVTQQIGVYLAACAANHWNPSFLSSLDQLPCGSLLRSHPIAPYFILDEVKPPKTRKATKALTSLLIRELVNLWSFPQLPPGLYDSNKTGISDLSDNELKLLVKRLNSFTLNPFSLTRREMAPFQRLLNSQSLSSVVSAVPFTQLLGIAGQSSLSGPLISNDLSTRKSPERLTKTRRKREKETKTKERDIPKKVPRIEGLQAPCTNVPSLSSSAGSKKFFRRLPDPGEEKNVKEEILQRMKVDFRMGDSNSEPTD